MVLGVWVWVWAFVGAKVFRVWVFVEVSWARIVLVAFGEGGGKLAAVVVVVAEVEGVAGLVVVGQERVHRLRVWLGFVELVGH